MRAAAARFDIDRVLTIPVSALAGDNVITRSDQTPWYDGPTLLEALAGWEPPTARASGTGVRLPVQYVVRADGFRGYAGTLAAGSLHPGDAVQVAGSGAAATVEQVFRHGDPVAAAHDGDPVVVTLKEEVDVARGDLLTAAGEDATQPVSAYTAELIWVGEQPLAHGRSYLLLAGGQSVPAVVTVVRHRRDVVSGEQLAARTLEMNDIGHGRADHRRAAAPRRLREVPRDRRLPARRPADRATRSPRAWCCTRCVAAPTSSRTTTPSTAPPGPG